MKEYKITGVSQIYYEAKINANTKEEAMELFKKGNGDFHIKNTNPIDILDNTIKEIKRNEESNIL